MRTRLFRLVWIVGICAILTIPPTTVTDAQIVGERKPIDMMIVIDNSCSMFPREKIVPGCDVWGNDPDFLRIVGADLFIARLGFGEVNEAEYQAGVISLGETARLISPLRPLSAIRDTLARTIANPAPELATGIVPALKLAYRELRESPARRPGNLPAIVLITDGVPYPREGQSDADIEGLIKENPDIPLFVMLLQNVTEPREEYARYIGFWQQMQARYTHVFTYVIRDAKQIEETYNTIVAQLQNTVPSEGTLVTPGAPLEVFVSRYVQKMVITVIHEVGRSKGLVTVKDPKGAIISDSDPGVSHFRGDDNPVEVISIAAPRLHDGVKEDFWTITSDAPVIVFLDRQGAYRINFLSPEVSRTDITNVYLATERWTPDREFVIRFNLLDEKDSPVLEPQPIQGKIKYPNGEEGVWRIPADLLPGADGVYEVRYNFISEYPAISEGSGRFIFIINAGTADERSDKYIPIATARLLVDVGPGCYIATISPEPLQCTLGRPALITVTLGSPDACLADTLRVRVFGESADVRLTAETSGVFTGDVTPLCEPLLRGLACSTQQETTLKVRMSAQLADGAPLPPVERNVLVQVIAPPCTPTPPPPPPPTPIPDRDGDGWNDVEDSCPERPGMAWFKGCPPPLWLLILLGALAVGFLVFFFLWLWPWIKVRTFAPPPNGYVLVCQEGEKIKILTPKSVRSTGLARRTNRVTIGGDQKKAHIYVKGLKPVEFVVVRQNGEVVILDAETGARKATFSEAPSIVSTSNKYINLRVGLDQSRLRC